MEKRVELLGYDVTFSLGAAIAFMPRRPAKALGIKTQGLKKVIFDFLKSHKFDVSIQPKANYLTITLSLLCQFAAIFSGVFGQNVIGRG